MTHSKTKKAEPIRRIPRKHCASRILSLHVGKQATALKVSCKVCFVVPNKGRGIGQDFSFRMDVSDLQRWLIVLTNIGIMLKLCVKSANVFMLKGGCLMSYFV